MDVDKLVLVINILKKLCCYFNMLEPMLSNNYQNISLKLKEPAKRLAETSMSMTAFKLRGANDSADAGVSADRTWQRKGFTLLNGEVRTISVVSGKVLDRAVLSKSYKGFTRMQTIKLKDPHVCDKWNAAHKCSFNYKGSSTAMEKMGAEKIFKQSVTKHSLYYISFYGDGDSKPFFSRGKCLRSGNANTKV